MGGRLAARSATPGAAGQHGAAAAGWSPWRAVVGFGLVSLAADVVYEGARSVTGPLLASLGASALVVGLVTGVGEALALVLRLPAGARVDRSGGHWPMAIAGYAMTAVSVPALAAAPFLGGAGLVVGCALVLVERAGKAVRSPAKSTLLAHAAGPVGLGRGFGVHKALDQVGAVAGPLLVAGVTAAAGALWPALLVLVVPGGLAVALLVALRRRSGPLPPRPPRAEPAGTAAGEPARGRGLPEWAGRGLPRAFWLFAASAALATSGLVTFAVISYHLVSAALVGAAAVPLLYAAAMAVEAVAALVTGWAHDRWGARGLLVLPLLVTAVPPLALSGSLVPAAAGVLVWGAATGLQDSTVKALVAQLVPAHRRATGYGVFAAVQGAAAVAGGALAGGLATSAPGLLTALVAVLQAGSLVLLLAALRARAA